MRIEDLRIGEYVHLQISGKVVSLNRQLYGGDDVVISVGISDTRVTVPAIHVEKLDQVEEGIAGPEPA